MNMFLQSCDDDPPSQELGSPDSPFLDYLLDSPRCTVPGQQYRTASPGDDNGLDVNSLPDSRGCSQVPTTQTLARTFEQIWKEPSFQSFGADDSFQANMCDSPSFTPPWQQDWTPSREFFGSGVSSDATSQPYIPQRLQRQDSTALREFFGSRISSGAKSQLLPPGRRQVELMIRKIYLHSCAMEEQCSKHIVFFEGRISKSTAVLAFQVSALSHWQRQRTVKTDYAK